MLLPPELTISALHDAFWSGRLSPSELVTYLQKKIKDSAAEEPVLIISANQADIIEQIEKLNNVKEHHTLGGIMDVDSVLEMYPLYGIPFLVSETMVPRCPRTAEGAANNEVDLEEQKEQIQLEVSNSIRSFESAGGILLGRTQAAPLPLLAAAISVARGHAAFAIVPYVAAASGIQMSSILPTILNSAASSSRRETDSAAGIGIGRTAIAAMDCNIHAAPSAINRVSIVASRVADAYEVLAQLMQPKLLRPAVRQLEAIRCYPLQSASLLSLPYASTV